MATPSTFPCLATFVMAMLVSQLALCGEESRVPLKTISGRPSVRATVNGHPLWLVIDTGSAVSVLEASAARACGLDRQSGGAKAVGMLGTEALVRSAPCGVEIGALRFPAQPWFVRRDEAKRGAVQFNLLGMDRLAATCRYLSLDRIKCEAVFGTQRFQPPPAPASAPLEMRRGLPYVGLRVGATRFSCLLDTGSSVALLLDPATASGLDHQSFRAASGRPFGFGDQPSARAQVWRGTLPEVALGTGALSKVDTLILPRPPALGYGAFERAAVTLDFQEHQLWIRK